MLCSAHTRVPHILISRRRYNVAVTKVKQLTRYYDNLLDTKPFAQQIDYNLPVKLIALAPTFHRHNYIDRMHCKLDIDFLQVEINNSQSWTTSHRCMSYRLR
jgi:RecB family endonuclease NucS